MAVFAYQGTSARGEKLAGELEAATRSEALRKLAMDRIQPLTLVAKADMAAAPRGARANGKGGAITGGIRLNNAQVILFTDELADFLNSGLQLEPALQLMENREEKSPVKMSRASCVKKSATAPHFPRRSSSARRISTNSTATSSRRAKSAAHSLRCCGARPRTWSRCRTCAARSSWR